jgi:hypothetical protein
MQFEKENKYAHHLYAPTDVNEIFGHLSYLKKQSNFSSDFIMEKR